MAPRPHGCHYAHPVTDTAAPPAADAKPRHSFGVRSIAAVLVFILAAVLMPVGLVAFWGHRTVTDAETYIATVQPLAYDAEVQDALSTTITTKIEEKIKPAADQLINEVVAKQPMLAPLVPILTGALDSLIAQVVDKLVRSEQFAQLWTVANTAAQKGLMAILEGNSSGPVSLQGDEVVLDLSSLVDAVKAGLVERGLTAAQNINIPVQDQQIVLLEAPQLAQIRTIYSFTSPIATVLLWIAIALFIIAILLARRRPRMVAWAGGVIAVEGLLLYFGLGIAKGAFVNTLEGTPFEKASQTFYDTLLRFLYNASVVTVMIGVIVLVVGLYLCDARWAGELRKSVNTLADKVAATIPAGPIVDSGAWVAAHARWLRAGVLVLFFLILLIGRDLDVARTIWAAVISLILLAVIQVWAAAGSRADKPAEVAAA